MAYFNCVRRERDGFDEIGRERVVRLYNLFGADAISLDFDSREKTGAAVGNKAVHWRVCNVCDIAAYRVLVSPQVVVEVLRASRDAAGTGGTVQLQAMLLAFGPDEEIRANGAGVAVHITDALLRVEDEAAFMALDAMRSFADESMDLLEAHQR
eukprot:2785935-Rhodomonas_salina.1